MKDYPGSKGASGSVQKIISLMPRHDRYFEPFLGGGIVLDTKRPAAITIAADIDADLVALHRKHPRAGVEYVHADALQLMSSQQLTRRDLVYLDPPYHPSTRSWRYFKFEMDDAAHRRLLLLALTLEANVMISGYRCSLYDEMLAAWPRTDYQAMTRGGIRTESVWCNFTPGESFHDTRFVGKDFRERERIKRKRQRWTQRFKAMSAAERAVIFEALESCR